MIKGIGIDLIKIQRMREAIKRSGVLFLEKVFTDREIEHAPKEEQERVIYFAMRFAAKESIVKAFGTGWIGVQGIDIEIKAGYGGEPVVEISGDLADIASRRKINKVLLSMSSDSEYAIAVSILL